MPEILHNERISKDFYLMKVKAENTAAMGQFYMGRLSAALQTNRRVRCGWTDCQLPL